MRTSKTTRIRTIKFLTQITAYTVSYMKQVVLFVTVKYQVDTVRLVIGMVKKAHERDGNDTQTGYYSHHYTNARSS